MPRPIADAASHPGIDMTEQRPGIFIYTQIQSEIETVAAHSSKAIQIFNRKAIPALSIFWKVLVRPDFVRHPKRARCRDVPGTTDQDYVRSRECRPQFRQGWQPDQKITKMIEFEHENASRRGRSGREIVER